MGSLDSQGRARSDLLHAAEGKMARRGLDIDKAASVPAASLRAARWSIRQTRLEAGIVSDAAAAEDGDCILPGWTLIEGVVGGVEEVIIRGGC